MTSEDYGSYSVDDEDQLQPADTLENPGMDDALDAGIEPPDGWSAGQGYGNVASEEIRGESLDQRIAQEEPDVDYLNDTGEDDLEDSEAVGLQPGQLVAPDAGIAEDDESLALAADVGIDASAATAEEAAMQIVGDDAQ